MNGREESGGRRFRVSVPGGPDIDAILSVDASGWSVSAVPWSGGGASPTTVQGVSLDGLAVLNLLAGWPRIDLAPAQAAAAPVVPPPVPTGTGDPVVYVLLGTDGFIHTLNLLGNALQYCQTSGATLVPLLENGATWRGITFHQVFAPRSPAFPSPDEHRRLLEEMPARLGLPVASHRDISYGFFPYTETGGDCIRFHGPLADHELPGLPWGRPLPPGESLLTGGAPWPPPGVPNGWTVAMQGLTLQGQIRDILASRLHQLPERYIGVHFRNTCTLSSLEEVTVRVREAARESGITDVVWATDDIDTLPEARALLPELRLRPFSENPRIRGAGVRALHFLTDEQLATVGFGRIELIIATLMDLYALVRADVFIPTGTPTRGMGTSWGGVVQHLRDTPALAEGFFGLPTAQGEPVTVAASPIQEERTQPPQAVHAITRTPDWSAMEELAALRESPAGCAQSRLDAALAALRSGSADLDSFDAFFAFAESIAGCSTAQLFQDLWALWESRGRQDGFFVEFGATDGLSLSNSYLLEHGARWSGIVAEPNPAFHAALERNRACTISHSCVWSRSDGALPFIAVPDGSLGRLRDVVPEDGWESGGHRVGAEILVPTVTLADLLETGGAPRRIDYLSLDTEGSELDILAAFDFSAWDVRTISVEHNHTPLRDALHAHLTSIGYRRKWPEFSNWDDWYVKVRTALPTQP